MAGEVEGVAGIVAEHGYRSLSIRPELDGFVVNSQGFVRGEGPLEAHGHPTKRRSAAIGRTGKGKRRNGNEQCHRVSGMTIEVERAAARCGIEEFSPRRTVQGHLGLGGGPTEAGGNFQGKDAVIVDDAIHVDIAMKPRLYQKRGQGGQDSIEERVIIDIPKERAHFEGVRPEITGEKPFMFHIEFCWTKPVSSVEVSANANFHTGGMPLQDGAAAVAGRIAALRAKREKIEGIGPARQGSDEGGGFGGTVVELDGPSLRIPLDMSSCIRIVS